MFNEIDPKKLIAAELPVSKQESELALQDLMIQYTSTKTDITEMLHNLYRGVETETPNTLQERSKFYYRYNTLEENIRMRGNDFDDKLHRKAIAVRNYFQKNKGEKLITVAGTVAIGVTTGLIGLGFVLLGNVMSMAIEAGHDKWLAKTRELEESQKELLAESNAILAKADQASLEKLEIIKANTTGNTDILDAQIKVLRENKEKTKALENKSETIALEILSDLVSSTNKETQEKAKTFLKALDQNSTELVADGEAAFSALRDVAKDVTEHALAENRRAFLALKTLNPLDELSAEKYSSLAYNVIYTQGLVNEATQLLEESYNELNTVWQRADRYRKLTKTLKERDAQTLKTVVGLQPSAGARDTIYYEKLLDQTQKLVLELSNEAASDVLTTMGIEAEGVVTLFAMAKLVAEKGFQKACEDIEFQSYCLELPAEWTETTLENIVEKLVEASEETAKQHLNKAVKTTAEFVKHAAKQHTAQATGHAIHEATKAHAGHAAGELAKTAKQTTGVGTTIAVGTSATVNSVQSELINHILTGIQLPDSLHGINPAAICTVLSLLLYTVVHKKWFTPLLEENLSKIIALQDNKDVSKLPKATQTELITLIGDTIHNFPALLSHLLEENIDLPKKIYAAQMEKTRLLKEYTKERGFKTVVWNNPEKLLSDTSCIYVTTRNVMDGFVNAWYHNGTMWVGESKKLSDFEKIMPDAKPKLTKTWTDPKDIEKMLSFFKGTQLPSLQLLEDIEKNKKELDGLTQAAAAKKASNHTLKYLTALYVQVVSYSSTEDRTLSRDRLHELSRQLTLTNVLQKINIVPSEHTTAIPLIMEYVQKRSEIINNLKQLKSLGTATKAQITSLKIYKSESINTPFKFSEGLTLNKLRDNIKDITRIHKALAEKAPSDTDTQIVGKPILHALNKETKKPAETDKPAAKNDTLPKNR